jgi:hypothetical protein
MHIHLRVRHWVLWWFDVGVVCGVVALINILARDLTRPQEHVILAVGIGFWVLGGIVCWASRAIQWQQPRSSAPHDEAGPAERPIADSMADVLNRQWQRYAARDVVSRLHGHHH